MAGIITRERATLNSFKITTHDCKDGSIKILSNFSASHNLPRRHTDTFSFDVNGLVVIKNLSEEPAPIDVEIVKTTSDALVVRSNRSASRYWLDGHTYKTLLQGGEALTLRSPNARNPDGGGSI